VLGQIEREMQKNKPHTNMTYCVHISNVKQRESKLTHKYLTRIFKRNNLLDDENMTERKREREIKFKLFSI